jgi:ABC-2 type transport system permease protein
MNELEKLVIVTEYELLKHLRRLRLYVVIGLALIVQLLILIAFPPLGDGYPDNVMTLASLLSMGPAFATIGAIFFAGDAISGEFESKTGYILFPNPVRKTTIVIGKYLACLSAMALIMLIAYGVVSISLLSIYRQLPLVVWKSFGLCLLNVSCVIGITFFFSSLSKGAIGGTVTAFIIIVVVFVTLEAVLMATGQPRWFLFSYAGDVMITVYNGYGAFGNAPEQLPQEAMQPPKVGTSIAVLFLYFIVFFLLSIIITNRREMV